LKLRTLPSQSVLLAMPTEKKLLQVLTRQKVSPPPIWLMRQAGRFLPEYRELRQKAENFLDFCYNPELAVEATLQPIRRFGFDAAILFSDILVIPDALGQQVTFEGGVGPKLNALDGPDDLSKLSTANLHEHLSPVYRTVEGLREALPPETTLIGFAGAPWTVATYMVEGGSSRDYAKTRSWAYRDSDTFSQLMDLLVNATADYLIRQIRHGAETVQLFDSWAGILPEQEFHRWSIDPARRIVSRLKQEFPDIPVIGFPRGAGALYADYVVETGVDAVSIDSSVPLQWAAETLQQHVIVQGNLDNVLLASGGEALDREIDRILETLGNGPHIFNLGHGILPHTPPENVARLCDRIRKQAG